MAGKNIRVKGILAAFAAGCLALSLILNAAARGLPAQNGILNFGKVSDALYRGAQPDSTGIENLQKLGIKTIINLRMTNDLWQPEVLEAAAHGILYTNVPLHGLREPTPEQVRTILSLIESLPGPVFIHCQHGCDRTGTIVACYRIQHDKWQNQAAMKEALEYGISVFERGMRKYIAAFGGEVKTTLSPIVAVDTAPVPTQTAANRP